MKPTEILTAILAVYAAILSTINLVVAIRAKRWRVAVTYSISSYSGKRLVIYRAVNLGERAVALKGFSVESLPEKDSVLGRIRNALNILSNLYGVRLGDVRTFTEAFVVKCEPPLPVELSPGRSCEMTVDRVSVLDNVISARKIAHIRGVFEDERGAIYRSPLAKVDWQLREIDFP